MTTTDPKKLAAAHVRAIRKVQGLIAEETMLCLYAFGRPSASPEPSDEHPTTVTLQLPLLPYDVCHYVDSLTAANQALEKLAKRVDIVSRQFQRGDTFPTDELYTERERDEMLASAKARATAQ